MKDYYEILGVSQESTGDEIRKQYRKLAMQYHPDRNPDDPEAENRFKEIAEAYGVLTDPVKKREYDRARVSGGPWQDGAEGFNYSQEDILHDLFRDPRFQSMFQSLLREFQRSGFRANPHFVRQSFFGGKGSLLFGGLFLFGSLAGPALLKSAKRKGLSEGSSVFRSIQSAVGTLLGGQSKDKDVEPVGTGDAGENDITYMTPLSAAELREGKTIQVVSQGPEGQEMLRVKIPPGSRSGQKLRLAGKGAGGAHGRGNLYLELTEQ